MLYDANGKEIDYTGDRDQNIIIANTLESLRKYFSTRTDKELTVETNFYKQIAESYRIWQKGGDNLVSSVLDMYVASASNYGSIIHSDSDKGKEITEIFKYWKDYVVNSDLNLPTGLTSVYKDWLIEAWGSRLCILYVVWGKAEIPVGSGKKYYVPVQMYVPNAYGVKVIGGETLGDHEYRFRTKEEMNRNFSDKKQYEDVYVEQEKNQAKPSGGFKIPSKKNHSIYVRAIGARSYQTYPIPFLFHRGTAQLVKVKEALRSSDYRTAIGIINDILMIKKGSDELTKMGVTTGTKELEALRQLIKSRMSNTQAFLTSYDTTMEHVHPETESLLSRDKYFEVDKDILASLGLITVRIEGERRESELNYKGFTLEAEATMKEFRTIMEQEIYVDFIKKNKTEHPELFREFSKLLYIHKPMNIWITDEGKRVIETWYNKGLISKRHGLEATTPLHYNVEKVERKAEQKDEELMYPPVVQNQEQHETNLTEPKKPNGRPQKQTQAALKTCGNCGYQLDTEKLSHVMEKAVQCPNCTYIVTIEGEVISTAKEYMEAPAWVENCVSSYMNSPVAKKKYPNPKVRRQHGWAICQWQYKRKKKANEDKDGDA